MGKECPFYQGVCGISEELLCYSNAAYCDIYKEYLEQQKKNAEKATDKAENKQGG